MATIGVRRGGGGGGAPPKDRGPLRATAKTSETNPLAGTVRSLSRAVTGLLFQGSGCKADSAAVSLARAQSLVRIAHRVAVDSLWSWILRTCEGTKQSQPGVDFALYLRRNVDEH